MKTCIIFCAAEFDRLEEPVRPGDYILAADGGLNHLGRLGLQPDGVIGDFDSLGYVPEDAQVFPVEKDDTDAMLAARQGLALGYKRFVFYGSLDGPRLDHTVANFQTLQFLSDHGAEGYLVGRDYLVTVLKNGTMTFPAEAEGILSLFCLGPDAEGVTLRNLRYPLENGTLTSGFPLGVSNHFIGKQAEITVKNGSLLALWERKTGLPTGYEILK
ncbi:MAG: thiamine diphosphokinase [Oscillospiraceae bacterium]|nr:thiamine diphosphokinase [Oscillospiraceae bacterium]